MKKNVTESSTAFALTAPTTNSVALTAFCGVDLEEVMKDAESSPFLPHAYLSNKKTEGVPPWRFVFVGETRVVPENPVFITHLFTTPFVRCLVGGKYTERAYPRKHRDYGGLSEEKYKEIVVQFDNEHGADAPEGVLDGVLWQRGLTHVVGLIMEGEAHFATIEAAKTLEKYWAPLLVGAGAGDGNVGEFSPDHSRSVVESKAGYEYLAAHKFRDWKVKKMSEKQKGLFSEAWVRQEAQVIKFLKK